MGILLEVNSETLSAHEASALVAFLVRLHPEATYEALGIGAEVRPPVAPAPAPTVAQLAASGSPQALADAMIAAEDNRVANQAAASPPPNPGGVEVDSEGLPWDNRIHAESKGKLAGGQWRGRRNVSAETKAAVEAELRAAMNAAPAVPVAQPAPAAPPAPQPIAAPAPAPVVQPAPAPVAQPAPAPVAQPAPAPAPAATAGPDYSGATFADLMMRIVDVQTGGVCTPEEVTAKCVELGLATVRDFHSRPDLIPAMMGLLPAVPGA